MSKPLELAVICGDHHAVKILLLNPHNNRNDPEFSKPLLHLACQNGCIAVAEVLLAYPQINVNQDIDFQGKIIGTALHVLIDTQLEANTKKTLIKMLLAHPKLDLPVVTDHDYSRLQASIIHADSLDLKPFLEKVLLMSPELLLKREMTI